jgi:anti-sigma-K factor RskA
MTHTNVEHIDLETLSAYVGGELKAVALARVEKHLAECASCAASLARLRSLVVAAGALPRDIVPPPEVWASVRGRITDNGVRRTARWWHNGWLASAAAVILVVSTALLVSGPFGPRRAKGVKVAFVPTTAATPVIVASVQRQFEPTLAELRETFDTQRGSLAPSTVRTLDRSMAVIDSAIAEARVALEADPASAALLDLLSAHYRRKVEFLKRATALSSSL